MTMRSSIIVLMMFWVQTFFVCAQNKDLLQQFEEEIKIKNKEVITIECSFTQTQQSSVFLDLVKKNGTFYFKQPGSMLLQFEEGDYIKMNDSWFEIKNANNSNVTKIASNPMLKNLRTILSACVVGDFMAMAKEFENNIERTAEEWVVTMSYKGGKRVSKIDRIVLHFDSRDMSLNLLKLEETSGDYIMYEFYQKKFNGTVDDNLFYIAK